VSNLFPTRHCTYINWSLANGSTAGVTQIDSAYCLVDITLCVCCVMCLQRLDNMARLPPAYCTKIFLQRDYSDGTAVRFQTKFPQELEGKVITWTCTL